MRDIWIVDFGDPYPSEPAGIRPALLVGQGSSTLGHTPTVFAVPMTTSDRRLDFHIELDPDDDNGLERTSYLQCEQLRSISKGRLIDRVGVADIATSVRVSDATSILLDDWS